MLGFTIPIMDGLVGVTFVESIHYFPFILLNLVASMRNIDGAMEESALNLGAIYMTSGNCSIIFILKLFNLTLNGNILKYWFPFR